MRHRRGIVATALLAAALALPWAALAASPFPPRRPSPDPIWVGEKHELTVSYLGIPGLRVTFEVLPFETLNRRKVYHVRGSVAHSSVVGMFYKIQDMAESWFDYESFVSHQLHLIQDETNLWRDSWEKHDHSRGVTEFSNKQRKKDRPQEEFKGKFPIPRLAQDTFSAFYFLRTISFDVASSVKIPVVSEGNVMQVVATVLGGELYEYQGKKLQAIALRLEKLDKQGNPIPGDNQVWISQDDRKMLLKFDVKTKYGHVIGELDHFVPGTPPARR